MQQGRRRSSFGSSSSLTRTTSLTRRSSISQRDILLLQQTLEKQQKVSSQLLFIVSIFLPLFTFFYLYSVHLHAGSFRKTFAQLFRYPFVIQMIPPLNDFVAWKLALSILSLQLIFHMFLPHDRVLVLSSLGNKWKPVNGFSSTVLLCLLYSLGSLLGLYRGDVLFLHFNSVALCLALISVCGFVVLLLSYYFGTGNHVTTVPEFYFGIEAHPTFLDIDLKHFIRTRVTFGFWSLFIISAFHYSHATYGRISKSVLCNGGVQLLYILRHSWAEDLYLNALDSKRANLGFYRMWTDMVFYPVLFTSPITVMIYNNRNLPLISNIIFTLLTLTSIYITNAIDRQKYEFRKANGIYKIGNSDPFFITAKYKNDEGEPAANLLLGFLIARVFQDEARCFIKYGQYWQQYCSKVPYKLLPGIY
ncbi:hypothetical protein WR25_01242 [Diploscapter pachys]|uniref:7-dehydrocholesterol reductase n=1 Tax=Diploscapter pachys TaxID=2018661 RepID=A0A2A2JXE7_9BILA|nr:hypothetical protein WR25_01242 [Diploscapter pachys]